MTDRPRRPGVRFGATPAALVRVGDVLWSDASMRDLRVIGVERELVRADGNLYADPEEPGVELTEGVVLTVIDERSGETQRLGAFAPHARLQTVYRAPPKAAAHG